ncbi:hypothetical protein GWO43_22995 [candidate division KSB1 bacterium]|nr:hypothetical protein [candidate division KSB1 bacterium]NIV70773.1 hypothetical protein [Phycisphaerae bacterium]NIR72892.1 hypothetical protein [candidate division KSB1 bacterium]NIT73690.1 hypothetical protein [candidate division KSB1 bacterium]NIU27562.1 hypothetical protein [candidate division KSB1 bacterium]
MEAEEHFYTDDPAIGPPDGRTTLKDVNYFFIGNGWITAAVQICSSGQGTPLGLILMHPEMFGPKRRAFTFDSQAGLSQTSLRIISPDWELIPDAHQVEARWEDRNAIPVVHAEWGGPPFTISERFYCPDIERPRIIREICLTSHWNEPVSLRIQTGSPAQTIEKQLTLTPNTPKVCFLEYCLIEEQPELAVELSWVSNPAIDDDVRNYWGKTTSCQFDSPLLNHLFRVSKNQLPANIAHSGRLDASIWQYNLEWVRDQSMIAIGLTLSGYFERAGTILDRLLSKFVSDKGDTLDSSRERPTEEVELDQNGELLLALRTYVDWSGDLSIVERHWEKVRVTAEFPLQPVFRHPDTALLHNQREYWERHALHGIEDGMELAYQLFVSMGLLCAADLAERLGHEAEAKRWRSAAEEIKHAMLSDPHYALIHDGHFIKRRRVNGEIQNEVHLKNETPLPKDSPLFQPGKHYLNPDSSAVLPIAFEFIDPTSDLAKKTLEHIEGLWNQKWQGGGYGRYNVTSEPDSAGPWPFPSLFIARAYVEMGEDEKVWRILKWLNSAPGSKSGAWFEFYGPRPVPPYPQVGIIPWTWAEQLILFVHHILGIRPAWDKLLIRPRLLSGVEHGEASIRLRNIRVNLHLQKAHKASEAGFRIGRTWHPYDKKGILIDMPERDLEVEVWFP